MAKRRENRFWEAFCPLNNMHTITQAAMQACPQVAIPCVTVPGFSALIIRRGLIVLCRGIYDPDYI